MIRPMAKVLGGVSLALLVAGALAAAAMFALGWRIEKAWNPDPVTVATASLQAVREQAVLTPFAARFVAVVTSEQHRLGFSARRTLIMPGLARYEVDLARLSQRDLSWNAGTRTLTVALPPITVTPPAVDLSRIQQYGEGGVLMTFTDAQEMLDAANRAAGERELMRQAREPLPMRLARDAAKSAIARSFAMPLKAAGIDATVVVTVAGT